jgi:phosphomannomutase
MWFRIDAGKPSPQLLRLAGGIYGTNQIRHGRLARGHRGGFHVCQRRARRAGDGGLLEVGSRKSEVGKSSARKKVVVGYDRRFFSDRFAQITAEVLAGNDFQVILTPEPTPTPSVSFAVKHLRAVGGVMITASHNPPIFNGFKLKSYYGGSSDSETCQAVESFLDKNPSQNSAAGRGRQKPPDQNCRCPPGALCRAQKAGGFQAHREIETAFRPRRAVRRGRGLFRTIARRHHLQGHDAQRQARPLFGGINPEPIVQNYARSQAFLKKHPHDICLVTDGDADRVGGMDGRGNYSDDAPDHLPAAASFDRQPQGRGRVVKALTTTSMVDKMCAAYGLPLVETGVGFKYICAEMLKGGVLLGAEESGGIGFPGHIPERDGIAAGLMLLELLATEKVSVNKLLAKLEKQFGPHRYGRIDTHYPLEKRAR